MDRHARRTLLRKWRKENPAEFEALLAFVRSKHTHYQLSHIEPNGVLVMRRKVYFAAFGLNKSVADWRRFLPDHLFIDICV